MSYKIESDVQLPSRRKYPIRELGISESFLVPTNEITKWTYSTMTTICAREKRKTGKWFTVKKVDDGIRVWRIK